jgi:hypothetical protein
MSPDAALAADRARSLLSLTQQLIERLTRELAAFEARRPQDVAEAVAQTQDLANVYRREAALVKANPAILAGAPTTVRMALIEATRSFEALVARHALAVDAARTISEGLVRTIAAEVAAQRTPASAYGAGGKANSADGRAFALNRTA